jgi:hypothetical protein
MGDRVLGRLAWVVSTLLLAGCGAVVVETYQYISLERNPDAEVVATARPTPGVDRWSIGEIPVTYEVARPSYTLRFEIDPDRFAPIHPAMTVRVLPAGEGTLGIDPDRDGTPGGCHPWVGHPGDPVSPQATWVHRPECGFPPLAGGLRVRFHVVDEGGAVVGAEEVPYTVEADGFYVFAVIAPPDHTRH